MKIGQPYSFGGRRIIYLGIHVDGRARISIPEAEETQLVDSERLQSFSLPITDKPVKWGHYLFNGDRVMITRIYRDTGFLGIEGTNHPFEEIDKGSFLSVALPVPAWTKKTS